MAVHISCGNEPLTIPTHGCDDCSALEERVEALEQCCEDVHTELDDKADKDETETAIEILEAKVNGLAAGWHYVGEVQSSEDLPNTFEAGEVYHSIDDHGYYVAVNDRPNGGGTIADFMFFPDEDTKYDLELGELPVAVVGTAIVGDDVVGVDPPALVDDALVDQAVVDGGNMNGVAINLNGSDNTTDSIHVVGQDGVIVNGSGNTITISAQFSGFVDTSAELEVADWVGGSQTITVNGVTPTNTVLISTEPSDMDEYINAGVICTAQGNDSLTFTAVSTPATDITVYILILG